MLRTFGEHIFNRYVEIKRQEWEDYRVQVTSGSSTGTCRSSSRLDTGHGSSPLHLRHRRRPAREVGRLPRLARRASSSPSGPRSCRPSSWTRRTTSPPRTCPATPSRRKALTATEDLQGGELAPAVIVYYRESGLTAADAAKIQADVKRLTAKRFPGVVRDGSKAGGRAVRSARAAERLRRPVHPDAGAAGGLRAVRRARLLGGRQGGDRHRLHQGQRRGRHDPRPGRLLARPGVRSGRRPRGEDHRRRRLLRRRHQGLRGRSTGRCCWPR